MAKDKKNGYIALIAVLIIVAVTLSIGLSLNILSIGEGQSGLLAQQSAQSFYAAESCLQEALLQLESDNSYTGDNLNLSYGTCTITVVAQASNRILTVEGEANGIIRRIEASADVSNPEISLQYWHELN